MNKIRHIFGIRGRMTQPPNEFDSDTHRVQESATAWAYEIASIACQLWLIYLVACVLPLPFYLSIAICVIAEWVLRANIASASRVILAMLDKGKKQINGLALTMPNTPFFSIIIATVLIVLWGGMGFLSQTKSFEISIGELKYNETELAELTQAKSLFTIDSTKAVNLLNQAKQQRQQDTKDEYNAKIHAKNNAINSAQKALNAALSSQNIRQEIDARQMLFNAKSIVVLEGKNDYSSDSIDFEERLNLARKNLANSNDKVLQAVKTRKGVKSAIHGFEMFGFVGLVLFVTVFIYKIEEYKKLAKLHHFGIESLFYKDAREPDLIEIQITDRQLRLEIFERHGLTEKQLAALKRNDSKLLYQAERKLSASGYILYFEDGKTYPRLKKLKQVA